MPISSIVIRTDGDGDQQVAHSVGALDGVSVSSVEPGVLIAITETDSAEMDQRLWAQIQAMPGVLSLNLTYHNFEDLAEGDA